MISHNKQTGDTGESIAAKILEQKGYSILERNFSNKFGEIDIIAKDKETIVFVEVKTKIGVQFGNPEEMVGRGKLHRIRNMATMYLSGGSVPCRIDVIAIVLNSDGSVSRLNHYENVY